MTEAFSSSCHAEVDAASTMLISFFTATMVATTRMLKACAGNETKCGCSKKNLYKIMPYTKKQLIPIMKAKSQLEAQGGERKLAAAHAVFTRQQLAG